MVPLKIMDLRSQEQTRYALYCSSRLESSLSIMNCLAVDSSSPCNWVKVNLLIISFVYTIKWFLGINLSTIESLLQPFTILLGKSVVIESTPRSLKCLAVSTSLMVQQ